MNYCKIIWFCLLSFCCTSLSAQTTINFEENLIAKYLGKQLYTFSDTSGRKSFNEIRALESSFELSKGDVIDFGVSNNNNWVKFDVYNNSDNDKIILNLGYPPIDEVEFYVIRHDNVYSYRVDKKTEIENRHYNHQFFLFDILIKKGETATCYLKLKSNKQLIAPITFNTQKTLIQETTNTDVFSGLYLGTMVVMILYNLFIYFSGKDKQYLLYVNYIFWVALAQACLLGYVQRFLFDSNIWLNENLLTLAGAMSGVGTILFVKDFLNTKNLAPRLNKILNFILIGDLLAILLLFFGFALVSYQIVNLIAALGAITIFITACVVYKNQHKPAFYFLIAWSIFLFSVLVFVLKDFGVFSYNFFTIHSVQIGSAVEAILLSFALADKMNILKKEKDQSRLAALRIAKENSRIVKEQNVVLEIKVKKRTEELEQKNEVLNHTLDNLQQTQLQLVESEKMASLGQLTAGIAHEINNPINFVTGNIGPLRRDVSILFEAIDMLDNNNKIGITDEEKNQIFEDFKEDQDYDYLKIEIQSLLKGIHEGASRTAEIVKSLRIFSRLDEDDLKLADINEGLESTLVIVNNMLGPIKVIKKIWSTPYY